MNKLFADNNGGAATAGRRELEKTGELTHLAETITNGILKTVLSDEKYSDAIVKSQSSNDGLDQLIDSVFKFDEQYQFLADVSEEDLTRLLKSQQSKRSRAKGKQMTLENYRAMVTAAVAERIIRIADGRPKGLNVGARRESASYTAEELEILQADPEALGKAIRNVQSKKCIMKAKANFNAESDEFKQILETEATLKALRDQNITTGGVNPVVAAKAEKAQKVEELLATTTDIEHMNAKDSKELLKQISEMLKAQ